MSKLIFLIFVAFNLKFAALSSNIHANNLAHVTRCGCTTTTTCSSNRGTNSCENAPLRTGKQGPKGYKGEKGEPAESNEENVRQLERRIRQMNEDLNTYWKLSHSFPSSCSEYITREGQNRKFGRVPLYPGKSVGDFTPILADCVKLPDIHGPKKSANFAVPFNSVTGRTLILEGVPDSDRFIVDFYSNVSSNIFLHISSRIRDRHVVRNNYYKMKWDSAGQMLDIPGEFPFSKGKQFKMEVNTDNIGYHCEVDGRKIFSYRHRQKPLSDINHIRIFGLTVSFVSFN